MTSKVSRSGGVDQIRAAEVEVGDTCVAKDKVEKQEEICAIEVLRSGGLDPGERVAKVVEEFLVAKDKVEEFCVARDKVEEFANKGKEVEWRS